MRNLRSSRVLPCLICLAVWIGSMHAADRSPAAMAEAANTFLATLSPEQSKLATFPFDTAEREHWGFVPTETFPRNGLVIAAMNEAQRNAVHALLKAGLSQKGYLSTTAIMDLESVLRAIESARGNLRLERDPTKYFVSIFGTPRATGSWGWRVEGHHLSLNLTIVNGKFVAVTPRFFGSNPAEVREGPKKGLRILADEEDSARALLMALNPSQRAKAVIHADAPNEIVTTNKVKVDPLQPAGIAAAELQPAQRDLLMRVLEAYTAAMASDIATDRMARVREAGVDRITFAWAGGAERGQKHYYRVQGPTFLIEYDNTQDDGNHIHSVWRDFDGDFGRDLLREHVARHHAGHQHR